MTVMRRNADFLTESEIASFFNFKGPKAKSFQGWYKGERVKSAKGSKLVGQDAYTYGRYDKLPGEKFDCETITDEWFKWFYTSDSKIESPNNLGNLREDRSLNGDKNMYLYENDGLSVYFINSLPFQRPYFKRIVMKKRASLLVPVYSASASFEEYPSCKDAGANLINEIRKDLHGIRTETFKATFDGKNIYGRCVIRDKPLPVKGITEHNTRIPRDRCKNDTIEICHGGFWLLLREEKLTAGDHLLYFKADSINYETEAKILIDVTI